MSESLLPENRQHLEIAPEARPKVEYKPVSEFDGRRRNNLTPEQRSKIGMRGGRITSANRLHMAKIGRRGGLAVSADRDYMRKIGQKGGSASRG